MEGVALIARRVSTERPAPQEAGAGVQPALFPVCMLSSVFCLLYSVFCSDYSSLMHVTSDHRLFGRFTPSMA